MPGAAGRPAEVIPSPRRVNRWHPFLAKPASAVRAGHKSHHPILAGTPKSITNATTFDLAGSAPNVGTHMILPLSTF